MLSRLKFWLEDVAKAILTMALRYYIIFSYPSLLLKVLKQAIICIRFFFYQVIHIKLFQGGVHLTKDPNKVPELVTSMVGNRLITKQTPPEGIPVSKVMVAEAIDIVRETYFCILMDREYNGPVIVASPDGGVDIEEVAEKTPERIMKMPVDIKTGLTDEAAGKVAAFLGFEGDLQSQCAEQIKRLYQMFLKVDCLQLEVNPLAETPEGIIYTADAKLGFDDNAQFRQKDIFDMEDTTESDPREVEAASWNLNYVQMDVSGI